MGENLRRIQPKQNPEEAIMFVPRLNANKNLPKKALSAANVKGYKDYE